MDNTPKSNKLIKDVLDNLLPTDRVCLWKGKNPHCMGIFSITHKDIEFLKILNVLPPNYCPTCRRMKRLNHINLTNLFSIPCNKIGHNENLISVFPKECPFSVWDVDSFSQIDDYYMAKDFSEDKTPYENLLMMRSYFPVPQFLNREPNVLNSPYSSGGRNLKNGYFCFGCYDTENVWYTNHTKTTKNIMDSRVVKNSEWVFNGYFSEHLYKSSFIFFSKSCIDSMFLYDCRNCINCFGCVNLRNKSHCIWNKQYTKEEYESFIKSNYPLSIDFINKSNKTFFDLVYSLPLNASCNVNTQNSEGVLLQSSSDMFDVFDSFNSQNVRHSDGAISHKDSMDFLFSGGNSHHLYMCTNVGSQSSNVKFSVSSKFCSDSEFIFNSKNCSNCFMCFGLQNKSYCILNKQYSKDEYFKKVDDIKSKMILLGEYNDGLGMEFSAQAYNFSIAQFSFPLTQKEILELGGYFAPNPETNADNIKIISIEDIPQTINKVNDDILDLAIMCPLAKRPYKITKSELSFLRHMGLPIPTLHPQERMRENFNRAPEGKIYNIKCESCFKDIKSIYNPENKLLLYCENCYKREVV
jgi:hypothetical protein